MRFTLQRVEPKSALKVGMIVGFSAQFAMIGLRLLLLMIWASRSGLRLNLVAILPVIVLNLLIAAIVMGVAGMLAAMIYNWIAQTNIGGLEITLIEREKRKNGDPPPTDYTV